MVLVPINAREAVFVIRVETLDPRPIVEALNKLGYEAAWPSLDIDLPADVVAPEAVLRAAAAAVALPGAAQLAATFV
jgi:hypothetical protein